MPKTHTRHKKSSFMKGDLVEYVGVGSAQRGIGIVLEEISHSTFWNYEISDDKISLELTHVRVYWQTLGSEETIHKACVRRIAEVTKAKLKNDKK